MRSSTGFLAVALAAVLAGMALTDTAVAGPGNSIFETGALTAPSRDDSARTRGGLGGGLRPQDLPEIYGPGKVTTISNVWMKVTNIGTLGNPFTATSSDPSGQWPGASGVEYLFAAYLYVGAKDPTAIDPAQLRRVSNAFEWRPPTLAPEDHIYVTFDGAPNGVRLVDDDSDGKIDEDPLDGHDDDGDGKIDEDFAAISQQEFTCLMRDDTPAAVDAPAAEKHSPRGLQVRQNVYAFSVPGANDFSSVEWQITNISNHALDSLYVGIRFDQDVGPIAKDRYYSDDLPEPRIPQGPDPTIEMSPTDPRNPNLPYLEVVRSDDPRSQGGACSMDTIHVNGFTLTDDDGDLGRSPGASTIQLLGHTIDPTGRKAPRRVGFSMLANYFPGTPYAQGGTPTNDQERYEAMAAGTDPTVRRVSNIDPATGLNNAEVPDRGEIGDYSGLTAIGPFLDMQPGETITVAWCLAIQEVDYTKQPEDLQNRYRRIIQNAIEAQKTYNGSYESRQGIEVPGPTDFGRETCYYRIPGVREFFSDCHDDSVSATRTLRDLECTWFDLDCNYCTGVPGLILKRWTASAPPPNPNMRLEPGDRQVTVLWDNMSEYTPDPAKGAFDFAGYKIWKAANWTRPVGSTGPGDDLWSLLATYYYYDPRINPLKLKSRVDGSDSLVTVPVLLNRETGDIIEAQPDSVVDCIRLTAADGSDSTCDIAYGKMVTFTPTGRDTIIENWPVTKYPIGHYQYVDRNVLNGFLYFYSVTAFDSTGRGRSIAKLEGRQAAVESEGVVPQASFADVANDGKPYVVPNPYRGSAQWDLTPNASDPTGTHIDFFNLPRNWTRLRIYTVSGDLVQEILPADMVGNDPQQGTATDAQASWNLVSRNGQDVVSGIYIFSVEGDGGMQRGKFIVIR